MQPYNIALIGTGTMGQRMIHLMNAHPRFRVIALHDPSTAMLTQAKELAPEAISYSMLDEMLENAPIDCLYIASPPASHIEYIHKCFDRVIPVFCEKPLSVSTEEALSIVVRAQKEKHAAAVNFPFATTPSLTYILKKIYQEDSIGAITSVDIFIRFKTWPRPWQQDATWLTQRKEGGFTREVLSHFLFAAQRIVRTEMKLVEKSTRYPDDPMLCETSVDACFTAGPIPISVSIGVGGTSDDDNRLTVTRTKGSIRMRDWYLGDVLQDGIWKPLPLGENPRAETMQLQLDQLFHLLQQKPTTLPTLQEAYQVQQHIEALLKEDIVSAERYPTK